MDLLSAQFFPFLKERYLRALVSIKEYFLAHAYQLFNQPSSVIIILSKRKRIDFQLVGQDLIALKIPAALYHGFICNTMGSLCCGSPPEDWFDLHNMLMQTVCNRQRRCRKNEQQEINGETSKYGHKKFSTLIEQKAQKLTQPAGAFKTKNRVTKIIIDKEHSLCEETNYVN